MDTPSPKQSDDTVRFVNPSLRPSPEQPSRRRIYIGVALLVVGFICIFFGGHGLVGQAFFIAGGSFVVASLFAFRAVGLGARRHHKENDIRKLYGTNKSNQSLEPTAGRCDAHI